MDLLLCQLAGEYEWCRARHPAVCLRWRLPPEGSNSARFPPRFSPAPLLVHVSVMLPVHTLLTISGIRHLVYFWMQDKAFVILLSRNPIGSAIQQKAGMQVRAD